MITIPAVCPCGQACEADEPLAGTRVACPTCGRPFFVPRVEQRAPEQPAAALPALPAAALQPLARTPASPLGTPVRPRKAGRKGSRTVVKLLIGGAAFVIFLIIGIPVGFLLVGALGSLKPWTTHAAADGSYSIDFPQPPQSQSGGPTGFPASAVVDYVKCPQPKGVYEYLVFTVPPGTDLNRMANMLEAGSMASSFGTRGELSQKQITVQGHPGLALDWTGQRFGTDVQVHAQLVIVGNRAHLVSWTGDPKRDSSRNMRKFFGSWKLGRG